MVWPATSTGSPASSAAMRATLRFSSPGAVGVAEHDVIDERRVDAAASDRLAHHERGQVVGPHRRSAPPWRPMGVRTALTIQASRSGRWRSRVTDRC